MAVSRIGKKYTKDDFAYENYEELEALAIATLNEYTGQEIDHNVYVHDVYATPNVSVRVLVFNDEGRLLMVREKQDGGWAVPGGWCDVYESSSQNGKKEVRQESGLDVEIVRLLGVFQREKYKDYPSLVSEYVHYYCARIVGGELHHNHETTDVGFFDFTALPELSKKNTIMELTKAYQVYCGLSDVQFD
ncbi:hypothetical protein SDC9_172023 [bioreactor metagenome]|uniref:Nudix hydrolase domain-containing protein n=1 Tax=bioreactor metagenome TaxID=1076179 RepID=A0A645GF20_9ZZZZ